MGAQQPKVKAEFCLKHLGLIFIACVLGTKVGLEEIVKGLLFKDVRLL